MTQFKDYFSTASDDYKRYRPTYPSALFEWLASQSPARSLAIDIGCGNGQATQLLAPHFNLLLATDASAAQIEQAQPVPNVRYQVSPAETIPAESASADLVTVAQAIHWFDHGRFFAEVDRVLKPGGVLAVWGYQLLHTDTPLDQLIQYFHSEIVGPYWPPERALLDDGYTRINFPFPRQTTPTFFMRVQWRFSHLLGYLNTWSAVKQYEKAKGRNPVEEQVDPLLAAWGNPETERQIYWPLILHVGKKGT